LEDTPLSWLIRYTCRTLYSCLLFCHPTLHGRLLTSGITCVCRQCMLDRHRRRRSPCYHFLETRKSISEAEARNATKAPVWKLGKASVADRDICCMFILATAGTGGVLHRDTEQTVRRCDTAHPLLTRDAATGWLIRCVHWGAPASAGVSAGRLTRCQEVR
jgi:hypothetical protein